MASKRNEVERAFRRVAILKVLVSKERQRAEAQPVAQRNIDLGIVEPDQPTSIAKQEIRETFNELQMLLDHLHVTHMAASFESEALPRLGKALGDAKTAIAAARFAKDPWPTKMLRRLDSFEGLRDIEQLLNLPSTAQSTFESVRKARNKFSPGVKLSQLPGVDATTTLELLTAMLEIMK